MKRVAVTVGPQGAGKTVFCKQLVCARPDIAYVSRDEVLNEIFGTVWLDPYTQDRRVAIDLMWQKVEKELEKLHTLIILDAWNGSVDQRLQITEKLRELGSDWIEAWYFTTPEDICLGWFLAREDKLRHKTFLGKEITAQFYRRDYRLYHSRLTKLDQGFDFIQKINPLQQTLFPYSDLLL